VKRLAELCQSSLPAPETCPRRGIAQRGCSRRGVAQRPQRQREQVLRTNLVDFRRWTGQHGLTLQQTAGLLQLCPRTLRQWHHDVHAATLRVQPLGRRLLRSSSRARNEVIELLDELGPATGVPTLHVCFPSMARAELDDLLKRYRRVWQKRHYQAWHVLRWQTPGTVWAMDFTQAPHPIDGLYPYLLAVRDLASGQQLLWLPLASADAAQTIPALQPLFLWHGAPLVLKTDNGSPFCAGATLDFLADCGVIPLFSPPYTPQYNGAIEAGISSLKTRTERQATHNGRPTHWSYNDADAAQAEANATARPKGPTGPTANQLWSARPTIAPQHRALFQASVNQQRHDVRVHDGWPTVGPLNAKDQRNVDRHAIRRALVEHGFLLFRRRRIPLPFMKKKVADIR
jgi:putative transposase